jgi:putative flippase GtrA
VKTAAKYIAFAGIASACNLFLQYCTLTVYAGPFALFAAMAIGTGAGLLVKFFLDKFFIFYHTSQKPSDVSLTFILYSLTGVGTTLLFWGIEVGFDWLFHAPHAKYVGAAIGLSLGYWIKYHLDKRIVFTRKGDSDGPASSTADVLRDL